MLHYHSQLTNDYFLYTLVLSQNNSKLFIMCAYHRDLESIFIFSLSGTILQVSSTTSSIVSVSRQYFTLVFDKRRRRQQCERARVSFSYLWLRLVSCKKQWQWRELASSRIHTSYRLYHQRLMARKARRGCRRRGGRFVPSGWLYCCSARNIKPHERGVGWLRP